VPFSKSLKIKDLNATLLDVHSPPHRSAVRHLNCIEAHAIAPFGELLFCPNQISGPVRAARMGPGESRIMSITAQNLEPRLVESPAANRSSQEGDLLDTMPWLPCTLSLEVPVVRFTIGDLLALKEGSIVETACHHTSDVPLRVNQLLIGWTEFDVIGDRLAVRITEQA
jgi:flagellar motor switch/type III secretory pathway protein FliN